MGAFSERFKKVLGIRISPCYEMLLEHHNAHLSDDPLVTPGWIPGIGNADFAIGTTQTFRNLFPDFPRQWIIIGYEGKTMIEKIQEEIDVYVALDVGDEGVHLVDSLGKREKASDHFRHWLAQKLARLMVQKAGKVHLFVVGAPRENQVKEFKDRLVHLHRRGSLHVESLLLLHREPGGKLHIVHREHLGARDLLTKGLAGFLSGALFLHPIFAPKGPEGRSERERKSSRPHAETAEIDGKFVRELACTILPGMWALMFTASDVRVRHVLEEFRGMGGTVLLSTLSKRGEARLQAVLEDVPKDEKPPA